VATGSQRPTIVVVACVLLGPDGSVLLARRPEGRELAGLWEFPGGKIEPGEQPEEALVRELEEELGVRAKRENLVPLTFVSHSYREFHLLMPLYLCEAWEGDVAAEEGQELAWVRPDQLNDYAMPLADEPLKTSLPALLQARQSLTR
jgi:8-oxo-dGTP diphosphatase